MTKTTVATIWLDGCSGCHMSFLDMDEALLDLAERIELVYSPLVDRKEFPASVDVTLVEGAVSSAEDLHKIQHVRAHTKILIALGDCAVTGNVPALRNMFAPEKALHHAYIDNAIISAGLPHEVIPPLLPKVRPVHQVVKVDVHLPGCPPGAALIQRVLLDLLDGQPPTVHTRFG